MNSEERRNDPVIRSKVAEIHAARQAVMLKAAAQLKELRDEIQELVLGADDGMFRTCFDTIWVAEHRVSTDADFMQDIGSETYIGNLAAGPLGEYIEKKAEVLG